jgi:transposase
LRVQHVGTIRVCPHRQIEGKVKTLSLKREDDKWFVVVSCDVGEPVKVGNTLPSVGLDVGLTHFATLSDGERIASLRYLKKNFPSSGGLSVRCLARKKVAPIERKPGVGCPESMRVSPTFAVSIDIRFAMI